MIPHSLAKELKEAGFLQRDWGDLYSVEAGHELMNVPQKLRASAAGIDIGETSACPTLSELIEACGGRFSTLVKNDSKVALITKEYKLTGAWIAASLDERFGEGSSPEEAAARLWLAIKK